MKIAKRILFFALLIASFSLIGCAAKGLEKEINVVFEVDGEFIQAGKVTQFDSTFTPELPETYIPLGYKFLGWTPYDPNTLNPSDPNLKDKYIPAGKMVHYQEVANITGSDVAKTIKEIAFKVGFNLDLDEVTSDTPTTDTSSHLLVVAWYSKSATSGLTDEIINNFTEKLKSYLLSQGYSNSEVNSVLLRPYSGNVSPSCEAIKNDGDVDIMIGWKSNVDTTGNLSYLESFPENADGSGITMGNVNDRWIHRLTDSDLAKAVFNWIVSEKDNNLFQ